ncbi:MAG: lamin tail domain-containing protein [Bacteroidota bacterium]|nr:lamin tail domain-containing protein [Bacteroidota bacterium]
MRKKIIIFSYFLLSAGSFGYSQFSENFADGNFTNNPAWVGGTMDFVVNSSFQLQSNNMVVNSSYYLSTPSTLATTAQWEFFVHIAFNPSSANYVDAYLIASASDLSLNTTSGYFIRIGNTDDEISLYRKDASGIITKIIDGVNGILNSSNNIIKIKVTRDAAGQWLLFRDLSGSGNSYTSEGSVTDNTFASSSYFGFFIKQSTASFFQQHYFDDITISNYVPDITPPLIESSTAITSTTVDVLFNKPVDNTSSGEVANYSGDNGLGMPVTATIDAQNTSLVHLTFDNDFTNGLVYNLTVNGVKDLTGNATTNATSTFSFYIPQHYDVVIDELFPDPNPQVTLPGEKFLELKNTSTFPINLHGWQLIDGSSTAKLPSYQLLPDSFVIVCAANSANAFLPYGSVLGVTNFPSMNIGGDAIVLKSSDNAIIHAIQYDPSFYKNEIKKDGGWTLEMIDTKNPCGGISNWKASTDANGGTPGRKNSVNGINNDQSSPRLLRAFPATSTSLTLVFDEPLDSLKAAAVNDYAIDNGLQVINAMPVSPFFNEVIITLNNPIAVGTVYSVIVKNVTDCVGNVIGEKNMTKFGIAENADSLDLVINEILFNPLPPGADYVELYNRSSKIIDLSKTYIANRNSSDVISNIRQVNPESRLLFPGDFIVLTSDPDAVKKQYITTNPDAFLRLNSMPSFPDDKGNVIILNNQGNIVDEVSYSDKWHFALLHNTEGVSLERINYEGPSAQSNFHSAATSAGYGTPGYKNSQYQMNEEVQCEITVSPEIFSPDNDGLDDFATINYVFPTPGYVANISIFDASGRPVRYLQKNSLSGIKGYYRWDGLDDKNRKLPQGIYIIYTEIFNTAGKKKQYKNTIVLARRF